jgi:hypothetical protein
MDALYKKLHGWLEVLDDQVKGLRVNQYIFWEVQKIIRANPKIDRPNHFYGWMTENYAGAMSVTVRKLADRDTRTISFRRFLEDIKNNPTVISRRRFKDNFVDGNYTERDADEGFDQLIGANRDYIDSFVVEHEIKTLLTKTSKLKRFVDKRIAHHENSKFEDFPTFKELDEAIEYLEELIKRYYSIFECMGTENLLGSWAYDWKAIFYHAWIEEKNNPL